MNVKIGRIMFELTENDRILDNGACYQLITRKIGRPFEQQNPKLSKVLFKKLLKKGSLVLANEKYKGMFNEYDLYKINK